MHVHTIRPTPAAMPTVTPGIGEQHPPARLALRQVTPALAGKEEVPSEGRDRYIRPRTLHLVDLENLLAGWVDERSVAEVWAEYQKVTAMRQGDHVIVSVSQRNAVATFFSLPAAVQRIIGSNAPDGADHALLDTIDIAWTARRFGQVMVATGDGIFTPVTARLHAQGLQMVQVIGGGKPATSLYRQCATQLYLTTAQRRVQARRRVELAATIAA